MTATVLDVSWALIAIIRDLVTSTAQRPFAAKLSEQNMLNLSASTHTCCDSLDLIRVLPYPLRRSLPAVRRCATSQDAPHAMARPTPSSVRLGSTDSPPSTSRRNSKRSQPGDAGTTSPSR